MSEVSPVNTNKRYGFFWFPSGANGFRNHPHHDTHVSNEQDKMSKPIFCDSYCGWTKSWILSKTFQRLIRLAAQEPSVPSVHQAGVVLESGLARSPSNWCPFSPTLFWLGGFPYLKRLQKKVGTLILTSLLEDLGTKRLQNSNNRGKSR